MKILVYSQVTAARIASSMGLPEYSYYFVLRDFLPVLQTLGEIVVVDEPEQQVDPLYDAARAAGERCVFLSFSPPHKTLTQLRCPTIPVFAWEFDSIPSESWLDEPQQDWRHVLRQCGQGITHSRMIVDAVRRELGDDFPIISVPSPVWDKFAAFRQKWAGQLPSGSVTIKMASGVVVDTRDPALAPHIFGSAATARVVQAIREHEGAAARARGGSAVAVPGENAGQSRYRITRRYLGEWYLKVLQPLLPMLPKPDGAPLEIVAQDDDKPLEPRNMVEPPQPEEKGLTPKMPDWQAGECEVQLSGVIFTALFNPYDGRKNWADMLTAFCAAFRDVPDATLVFKLGHHEYLSAMHDMLIWMARMPRFQCRIVLLHGYLDGDDFEALVKASAYAVNASHGEGQCLPLMEFLSCGKPAVAPRHSAMLDYIDEQVAFVVDSWLDSTAWSHDPRLAYRTRRHQIDWASLRDAYLNAYQCITTDPERYQRMATSAVERMRGHCSREVARGRIQALLNAEVVERASLA